MSSSKNEGLDSPAKFSLEQNYPNPFNPATKIRFSLQKWGFVSLKVFDILGREAASLCKEEMPSGEHEITFDASGLSAGVYLYRLSAGTYSETKTMLLLK